MFWCFSRAASQRLPVWKGCLKVSRRLRVWVWLCDCVCRPVLCGRVWPSRCVHAASSVRLSLAYISVCVCSSAASGATEGRTMCRSSDGRTKAPACASSCNQIWNFRAIKDWNQECDDSFSVLQGSIVLQIRIKITYMGFALSQSSRLQLIRSWK